MTSLVAITEEGETIEIGTVGSEGFIGVPIIHECGITPYRVIVHMPAGAARIEPRHLLENSIVAQIAGVAPTYAHVLEVVRRTLVCGTRRK